MKIENFRDCDQNEADLLTSTLLNKLAKRKIQFLALYIVILLKLA